MHFCDADEAPIMSLLHLIYFNSPIIDLNDYRFLHSTILYSIESNHCPKNGDDIITVRRDLSVESRCARVLNYSPLFEEFRRKVPQNLLQALRGSSRNYASNFRYSLKLPGRLWELLRSLVATTELIPSCDLACSSDQISFALHSISLHISLVARPFR